MCLECSWYPGEKGIQGLSLPIFFLARAGQVCLGKCLSVGDKEEDKPGRWNGADEIFPLR